MMRAGLKELESDPRDFSLGGIFGTAKLEDLPSDFVVSEPLIIKDQGDSDLCTAFAVTEVSEDQEGIELSPEYQFAKIKQLEGSTESWGADLRIACKSACDYGSLPQNLAPLFLETVGREGVADWTKWPSDLDTVAKKYAKASYFKVDGPYDLFDNIRASLWKNRSEKRSIVVGAKWRESWTNAEGGFIPKSYEAEGFGHAFKIFGWKQMDGEIYLIAQLSNTNKIGDKGIFYFPREVVNKEFRSFGQFMFKDLEKEVAEYYHQNNIQVNDSWWIKLLKVIINMFKPLNK